MIRTSNIFHTMNLYRQGKKPYKVESMYDILKLVCKMEKYGFVELYQKMENRIYAGREKEVEQMLKEA